MKTQKYIVAIEMPAGDMVSPGWIQELIQDDCDVENAGRLKVSVEEIKAEESLSKTLDEAAEEYIKRVSDGRNFRDLTCGFITGAKWMAGQGVSWEDQMTYYDGFLLYGKDERAFTMEGNFNEGDKVIVQIRKK